MKQLVAFTLLAILGIACLAPAQAQNRISVEENARRSQKAAKKQRKAMKKAAKQQRKAMKKQQKAQRKAMKKAQRQRTR